LDGIKQSQSRVFLGELKPGVYLLKLYSADKVIGVEKLIKI
jgi:hypothetical protein